VEAPPVRTAAETLAIAKETMKALASKTRQAIQTKLASQRGVVIKRVQGRVQVQQLRQNARLAGQRRARIDKLMPAQRAAAKGRIEEAGPQLRIANKNLEGRQKNLSNATTEKGNLGTTLSNRQGDLANTKADLAAAKELKPTLEGVRNDAGASRTDAATKGSAAGAEAAKAVQPIKDTNAALNTEGPKLAALKDGIGGKVAALGATQGRIGAARTDAANSSGLAKQAGIDAGTKAGEAAGHVFKFKEVTFKEWTHAPEWATNEAGNLVDPVNGPLDAETGEPVVA
jgi:hypothetical protein